MSINFPSFQYLCFWKAFSLRHNLARTKTTALAKIASRAAKNFENVKDFKRKDTNDKYWTEKNLMKASSFNFPAEFTNKCAYKFMVMSFFSRIFEGCDFSRSNSHQLPIRLRLLPHRLISFSIVSFPYFFFSRNREHRLALGINKKLCKHSLLI